MSYDYTQACNSVILNYENCPDKAKICTTSAQCRELTCTPSDCCPAPLANSHYVSNNCETTIYITCQVCIQGPFLKACRNQGRCQCSGVGTCKYACDTGYIWDGVACVLPSVMRERLKRGVGI